ncbi:MAG: hypothetical protein PHO76_10735 [Methylotenera sp.]|nr:hypothetical protein [Methylotenera sp.]MDD4926851.1 hypothetical protein [Methylotenera sp.]
MDINTQDKNTALATEYLSHIAITAERAALIKNHPELKIPVESYQYAVNGLAFIPISDAKKAKTLAELAAHYAEKIEAQGTEAFDVKDRVYAVSFVEEVNTKRNIASAKYFHDNIDDLYKRTYMITDPQHVELWGAYYKYIHAENTIDKDGDTPSREAMSLVKERMTRQIEEKSPEFFRPNDIAVEQQQTR